MNKALLDTNTNSEILKAVNPTIAQNARPTVSSMGY